MVHTTALQVEDVIILFPFSFLNLIDTRSCTADSNWGQMIGLSLSSSELNVTDNDITFSLSVDDDGKHINECSCIVAVYLRARKCRA